MGNLSYWQFVKNQWAKPLPVNQRDLSGQVVVVTGANTGLGFEAAKHFARMKPERLILACRNQEKAEAALRELREETAYAGGEVWALDLGEFASVVRFAEKFNKEVQRLDILVANAAMFLISYEPTTDGLETMTQVNHLATALLCLLLLPKMAGTTPHALQQARRPRLIIVSSETHFWTRFDKEATDSENLLEKLSSKDYCTFSRMCDRYPQTKLLNVFFTRTLASLLPSESPVIIDTVNPGMCKSTLATSNTPWYFVMLNSILHRILARTTEVGSRQLVWAALEGSDEAVHGQYVADFAPVEPADYVLENPGLQTRIWDETIRILAKAEPKVADIVQQLKSGQLAKGGQISGER